VESCTLLIESLYAFEVIELGCVLVKCFSIQSGLILNGFGFKVKIVSAAMVLDFFF